MSDSRKAAEQEYVKQVFDFGVNPIGSRDWEFFWDGWQAAEKNDVYQETVAWQTARANHAERERDEWKAKAEANERDAERYRWLRREPKWAAPGCRLCQMQHFHSEKLDDEIDAARSAEKEKE